MPETRLATPLTFTRQRQLKEQTRLLVRKRDVPAVPPPLVGKYSPKI
jgi:hypothetical protein